MPTVDQVMDQLQSKGSIQTVRTFSKHGAPAEKMFGVKVADLKQIVKQIKGDQDLALKLYATGNSDAMYLAGLVADGSKMSTKALNQWAKQAPWYMISDYTVAWVAAEHPKGADLALKWINSDRELVASAGWSTLSAIAAIRDDDQLDLESYTQLLRTIESSIDSSKNRVRYSMNGFVIAVGCFIRPLHKLAMATAKKIGKVEVAMGETSCKVPLATERIAKVASQGHIGKKRLTAKC